MRIRLAERFGESLMSGSDGETLHGEIVATLSKHENVILDFANVTVLLSAFLNPAIGILYYNYSPDFLNAHLSFENTSQVQSRTISEVLKNAKEHIIGGKDAEAQRDALRKMFLE